jgi:UDP-glucose 4-epimerase
LVYTSTGAVYGAPKVQPITESTPFAPMHPYGASKVAAEQIIGWQAATGTIGAITVRIFNAAGAFAGRADRDLTRIIPKTVEVAAGRAPKLSVNGDGTAVRDYVHVTDIAAAIALALEAATPGTYKAYNLGAVPASVAEIIASTERVSGRRVAVEHLPANPNEAPELRADTNAIRTELGWKPSCTTLDELVTDQWSASLS